MNLEGNWSVMWENQEAGQCRLTRCGLYWNVECVCSIPSEEVLRLVLLGGELPVSLGIPIPQGSHLVLERKLPAKNLPVPENVRLELWSACRPLVSEKPGEAKQTAEEPSVEGFDHKAPDLPQKIREDTPDDTAEEAADEVQDMAEGTGKEASEDEAEALAEGIREDAQEDAPEDVCEDEAEDESGDAPWEDAEENMTEEMWDDTPETAAEEIAEEIAEEPEKAEPAQKPEKASHCQQWIPYDPNAPISGLEDWQNLRAVVNEEGKLLLGHCPQNFSNS